jgi:hypothetical protein
MSQKQEEQQTTASKEESIPTSTEDCQQISDKCDVVLSKIKKRIKIKKTGTND